MDRILKIALLGCCMLLVYMLWSEQSGPFVHLIVAPAIGLLGSALLLLLAVGAMLHHAREFRVARAREGSDV